MSSGIEKTKFPPWTLPKATKPAFNLTLSALVADVSTLKLTLATADFFDRGT